MMLPEKLAREKELFHVLDLGRRGFHHAPEAAAGLAARLGQRNAFGRRSARVPVIGVSLVVTRFVRDTKA